MIDATEVFDFSPPDTNSTTTDNSFPTTELAPKPSIIWDHGDTGNTSSSDTDLFQPTSLLDSDSRHDGPRQSWLSHLVNATSGYPAPHNEAENYTSGLQDYTTGPPAPDYTASVEDYTTGIPDYTTGVADYTTGIQDYTRGLQDFSPGFYNHTYEPQNLTYGAPNFTSGDLWEENEEYARLVIPSMVYVAVLMIVGVPGNSLAMYVYGVKFRGATQHFLIVGLAVCDLIIGLIAMPTEIADLRFHLTFSSDFACRLLRFVSLFCTLTSNCLLIVIAVDRYRRVCHPLGRQMGMKEARIGAVLSVLLALVVSWPLFVITGLRTTETSQEGLYGKDCSFSDEFHDTPYPMALMCLLGAGFVTMTVVLAVLYFQIWRQARAHRPGLRSTRSYPPSSSRSRDKVSSASSARDTPPNSPTFTLGGKGDRRRVSSTSGAQRTTTTLSSVSLQNGSSPGLVQADQRLPLSVPRPDMLQSMSEAPPTDSNSQTIGQSDCQGQQAPPTVQPDMLPSSSSVSETSPPSSSVSRIGQNGHQTYASRTIASQPDVVLSMSPVPSPSLPLFSRGNKKSKKKDGGRSCVSSSRHSYPSVSCLCDSTPESNRHSVSSARRTTVSAISFCCHGRRASDDVEPSSDVTRYTSQISQNSSKGDELSVFGSSNDESFRLSNVSSSESDMSVFTLRSDYDSPSVNLETVKKNTHGKESRAQRLWPLCCHRNGRKGFSMDKTTLVAFAVTLVFVMSFLPYLTLMLIRGVFRNFDNSLSGSTQLNFYNVFVRSYFLNSAANPIIYGLFNARFRLEVATLLKKMASVLCFCCRCSKMSKC